MRVDIQVCPSGKKRPPRRLHKRDLFVYVCVYRMVCKKYPVGNNITPEMPPPKKEKIAASFNCPKPIPPKRVSIDRRDTDFRNKKDVCRLFSCYFSECPELPFFLLLDGFRQFIIQTRFMQNRIQNQVGYCLSFVWPFFFCIILKFTLPFDCLMCLEVAANANQNVVQSETYNLQIKTTI